jgi:hypothetical protein
MPPVAKRFIRYAARTPHRVLQDAVLAHFDPLELFFASVADELKIQRDSVAGTYYGFMRGKRALPDSHKQAYMRLTGVSEDVLDAIEGARSLQKPERRDRLEEVAERLDGSLVKQRELTDQLSELEARVQKLEVQRRAAPAASKGPRSRSAQ